MRRDIACDVVPGAAILHLHPVLPRVLLGVDEFGGHGCGSDSSDSRIARSGRSIGHENPGLRLACCWFSHRYGQPSSQATSVQPTFSPCGPAGTAHVRTTLCFGLTRPSGRVSEDEWRTFLRQHVTPRFPDGLTVWEAQGQWRRSDGRVARERSKVLLLVHDDTAVARGVVGEFVGMCDLLED